MCHLYIYIKDEYYSLLILRIAFLCLMFAAYAAGMSLFAEKIVRCLVHIIVYIVRVMWRSRRAKINKIRVFCNISHVQYV